MKGGIDNLFAASSVVIIFDGRFGRVGTAGRWGGTGGACALIVH